MLDKLINEFLLKGYMRIRAAEPQIGVVYKLTENGICYLCFFDDTEGFVKPGMVKTVLANTAAILSGSEKLRSYSEKGMSGLAVLLTNDPSHTRQSLADGEAYWLIHQPTKRLMVFDDQPGDFYEARQCIEDYLSQNGLMLVLSQMKVLLSPVNISLILINILIFVVMELAGSTENSAFMEKCGALVPIEIMAGKRLYTLFTSAFLHFGVTHLACNMISLLYLGRPLEKALGSFRYLLLYIISALGGNIISVFWYVYAGDPFVVSAGASGAICGVAGGLAFIMLKQRRQNKGFSFIRWLIFVALIAGQGIGDDSVNNAAHIGGMITGFLVGMLFYYTRKGKRKTPDGDL